MFIFFIRLSFLFFLSAYLPGHCLPLKPWCPAGPSLALEICRVNCLEVPAHFCYSMPFYLSLCRCPCLEPTPLFTNSWLNAYFFFSLSSDSLLTIVFLTAPPGVTNPSCCVPFSTLGIDVCNLQSHCIQILCLCICVLTRVYVCQEKKYATSSSPLRSCSTPYRIGR